MSVGKDDDTMPEGAAEIGAVGRGWTARLMVRWDPSCGRDLTTIGRHYTIEALVESGEKTWGD